MRSRRFDAPASDEDSSGAVSRGHVNDIVVNLARRSQSLVERQLKVVEELERDERDPERLAALFRLERLTARMRRTNENLLVLAGGSARRRGREPVPLAALVLAAVSENEQYQRVRAEVEDGVQVSGVVAADLVHLLAELLENAVGYSPPSSVVRVTGERVARGARVTVTDQGIGMRSEVQRELNALLADPPEVDASVTERMGLVVVGHLAARHDLRVTLAEAAGGVRATVELPEAVLEPRKRDVTAAVRLTPGEPFDAESTMRLPAEPVEEHTILLPSRVPMASLPPSTGPEPMTQPVAADPATERVLTRLYDGLRDTD
ncbi:ATP-binding protein [Hamadaea sp. NPDC050747]|uniref:sensor histidine kinase n=1 Tax=Hamadaea sp. NPDC050747 TaxID=3155789 RepID=UPI003410B301